MRNLLFWGLFPLVLPQALWVRKTAPRFAPAAGPESGTFGEGRPIRLVGIGDSIIAGVGASTLSRALIGATASSLADLLDAEVRWHAVGKSGARSLDILEKYVPRLPAEPADVFVVSVGVNDVTGLVSQSDWETQIARLLEALKSHSPQATIAFSGLPPLGQFPLLPQPLRFTFGVRARSFDLAARDVVQRVPDAIHVPLDFEADPDGFSNDGFHPSEASYAIYGKMMADAVSTVHEPA